MQNLESYPTNSSKLHPILYYNQVKFYETQPTQPLFTMSHFGYEAPNTTWQNPQGQSQNQNESADPNETHVEAPVVEDVQ